MAKKVTPQDPNWRDQLYAYGFTDEDIDALNVVPLHKYFVRMNDTFQESLKADIADLLADNWDEVRKDITGIVIEQNEKWGTVITEVMKGIDSASRDVSHLKKEMVQIKTDNDKVHEELRKGLKKLMIRNNYWMILLRLAATGIIMYFVIKFAHDHWWTSKFLSFLGI